MTTHGRTHRLELADATLRDWTATVLAADLEQGIVLDRSAFYPGGGGQPPDHGVLLWGGVRTRIEDARRTALMRTHSGLHVLSGVVFRDFGALVTGSNMEPLEGRLDFNLESVPDGFKETIVRIVDIAGLDVQADGGTQVASTAQVGRMRVSRIESKGKGFRRIRVVVED
jgi:misacylated tRNA(Ala) deacylase